jgi:hypothetical protein
MAETAKSPKIVRGFTNSMIKKHRLDAEFALPVRRPVQSPQISPIGSRGPQNSPLRFKQTPFAAIPLALRSHLWYKQIIQVCPLPGRPEFHAEWLRDGPCDATTTCLGKPGVWCQLSLAIRGGEHEIRQSLQRSFLKAACKLHESYQVRSSLSRSRARVSAVARIDARDL